MGRSLRVNLKMVPSVDWGSISGLMAQFTKDNGPIMNFMAMVNILGMITGGMLASGRRILCMARGHSITKMVECILEST